MTNKTKLMALACVVAALAHGEAVAAFFGAPKSMKPAIDRLQLDRPTLAPMAHAVFCVQHPADCEVRRMAFRGGGVKMDEKRWDDLKSVNNKVNRSIVYVRNDLGHAGDKWIISPRGGDCNDYAVTKRHELLERGWPSRSLLLAEVVTTWGEHHLVLVVRTRDGDLVLDSIAKDIRPFKEARYRWLRLQSPRNPKHWETVRPLSV